MTRCIAKEIPIRDPDWLEQSVPDLRTREALEAWAGEVFLRQEGVLDQAIDKVAQVKTTLASQPNATLARASDLVTSELSGRFLVIWDHLERFGWDVVGLVDDGDDAKTVVDALRWAIANDPSNTQVRSYLKRELTGLGDVARVMGRDDAVAQLRADNARLATTNTLARQDRGALAPRLNARAIPVQRCLSMSTTGALHAFRVNAAMSLTLASTTRLVSTAGPTTQHPAATPT